MSAPVIVLDRDGTIVVDRNYLSRPDQLEFEHGAIAGLKRFAAAGCRLFIVTNQSGIGRGYFTEADLRRVQLRLDEMLAENGVRIEATYHCPHLPSARCDCRKPRPELLLRASREHDFDPASVVVIGDKESDVELGRGVGARAVLLSAACGVRSNADAVVTDLNKAADFILTP